MKCDATPIRASAAAYRCAIAHYPSERVEREDLGWSVTGVPRLPEEGTQVLAVAIERCEERVPEQLLLATAGGAVECRRRLERGASLCVAPEGAENAAEVDAAERGEPDVAGGLGFGDPDFQRCGAGS